MSRESQTPVYVTLGPAGTNHEMVTRAYAAFRNLRDIQILLVDDFNDALDMVATSKADYLLICGVHPQCVEIVGKGSFVSGVHVMDVFISASQELGIVTRKDVLAPKTIALQPATASYADLSAWPEKVHVGSIIEVAEGLVEGRFHSGLTNLKVARENPEVLRVDVELGSPDDPWLVMGRKRITDGKLIACKDAPIVGHFHEEFG